MITPIILLILLTAPWLMRGLLSKAIHRPIDGNAAAAIGLGMLFMFTGVGHFVKTEAMTTMLPSFIPMQTLVVQLSGILEFVIAIALFFSCCRKAAAQFSVVLLILLFPLNIYAAINHAPMGGHEWGPVYLWIRGPLQAIILTWTYFLIIKKPT